MLLVLLALIVALAAATRSTWSPCGLSMLSTITPMAEQSRGHRYGVTATWFILGAGLGGLTLGGVAALLAAGLAVVDLSTTATFGLVAVLAAVAAMVDAGTFGRRPPFFRRQVDDAWLGTYRAWVYGGGFGWQIGVGLARGLVVLLGARITSPGALGAVHQRLDALEAPVRWAVVGVQVGVAVLAGIVAWGPLAAVAVVVACAVALAVRLPLGLREPAAG